MFRRMNVVVVVVAGIFGLFSPFSLVIGQDLGKGIAQVMVTLDGHTIPDIGPLPTAVPVPATNLNYASKIKLGEQLYFDGRLSKNNAISCAFCHTPGLGFADPKQTSLGVDGKRGGRQAPTVYNTAFNPVQFWDGRAGSLEEQAIGPIINPVEMAETYENVVKKTQCIERVSRAISSRLWNRGECARDRGGDCGVRTNNYFDQFTF